MIDDGDWSYDVKVDKRLDEIDRLKAEIERLNRGKEALIGMVEMYADDRNEERKKREAAEAKLERECRWTKYDADGCGFKNAWVTSCGEDYSIVEEWDENPSTYCGHCGGKVKVKEHDDE